MGYYKHYIDSLNESKSVDNLDAVVNSLRN